ncbi:MAG: DNA/RNA nuclease SfsA [Clostridia bacterium]|nr:DNA/RNA nuclease SfsA [Clostridia bacterium]
MIYSCPIIKGVFLRRPNRFIAHVLLSGREEVCHVKNTGRCKELLVENAVVYLAESANPLRKTKWDIVAVEKQGRIFNIDSQIPNDVAREFVARAYPDYAVKREVFYKNSRFDLMIEKDNAKTFIEVKGVTLEKNNIAMFPDAPTERGKKHLLELIDAKKNGLGAKIIFVIQFDGAQEFRPNWKTDPQFAAALVKAKESGVEICAYDCFITADSIKINNEVKVCLDSF